MTAFVKAPPPLTDLKFEQMTRRQKVIFIMKVTACIATFGFAFPTVAAIEGRRTYRENLEIAQFRASHDSGSYRSGAELPIRSALSQQPIWGWQPL